MEQLSKHPDSWQKKFTVFAPLTGRSIPLTDVKSSALNLGAFGVGLALLPGNQKVHQLADWNCHHHSPDLRDWFLTMKAGSAVVRAQIRLWPADHMMPFALKGQDEQTLFTIAPEHFQASQKCLISLTLPQHDKLSFLPHFGNVTAADSPLIDLFLGAEFKPPETT